MHLRYPLSPANLAHRSIRLYSMKSWIGLFLLLLITSNLWGQDYAAFPIGRQDGLPSNSVYDLFQDDRGFVWVSTENGLARYNGHSFVNYQNEQLRSQAGGSFCQDAEGTLWLRNFSGEILFVKNDSLQRLDSWEEFQVPGFPMLDCDGEYLLIGTNYLSLRYHIRKHTYDTLLAKATTPSLMNTVLERGRIWAFLSRGTDTIVQHIYPEIGPELYPGRDLGRFISLAQWQDSLYLLDRFSQHLHQVAPQHAKVLTRDDLEALHSVRIMHTLGDSLLAMFGTNGLWLMDKLGNTEVVLAGKNVSAILPLREGGMLVGTLNEGMFFIPSFNTRAVLQPGTQSFYRLAASPLGDGLLVGDFTGGLHYYGLDGHPVHHLRSDHPTEVQGIYADERGLLAQCRVLKSVSLADFQLRHSGSGSAFKQFVRVGNQYYGASSNGLYVFGANNDDLRCVALNGLRTNSLAITPDTTSLWVGTQLGVRQIPFPITPSAEAIPFEPNGQSLGASDLLQIAGGIAIGTQSSGLYVVSHPDQAWYQLTVADGLPSNHILALASQGNQLLIGTDNGMALLNLDSRAIALIDQSKGLLSQEVFDVTFAGGKMWAVHSQGLQSFAMDLATNAQIPQLIFQRIEAGGRIHQPHQPLRLRHNFRQLTLQFDVGNSLKAMGKTNIYYRIREVNGNEWNQTTLAQAQATYLGLPPGRFTFEAYATNEDGRESAPIVLPIHVLAPLWQQGWFLVLATVLVAAGVGLVLYRNQRRKIRADQQEFVRQRRERDLRIARLTSIRAQINPHFIFNTMSMIQARVLQGKPEEASETIHDFSQLMRKVLDFSATELVTLESELSIIRKYLSIEQDRFEGTLTFHIVVDEALESEMIRIPSLITQPFVENALRHGLLHKEGPKELWIEVKEREEALTITIRDNGIGRKAAGELRQNQNKGHRSFATEAYEHRIALYNEAHEKKIQLTIEDLVAPSGMASGTAVHLTIPYDL